MFSKINQFMVAAFLIVLALIGKVQAQVYTTTLPWDEGNTIVVSQSTDALGETVAIQTLSTITTGLAVTGALTTTPLVPGALTTTPLVPLVPTTTALVPTTTKKTTSLKKTTATPAIVATPTTTTSATGSLVSTTSWYWFTSDDGNVYSTYYTPSYTTAVSATPAPSGTIMDYTQYQASVNSAIASGGANAALDSGAEGLKVGLMAALAAGIVGVGAVLLG